MGLEILATMNAKHLEIKGDSYLVIKQLTGEFEFYNTKMKEFCASDDNLLKLFANVVIIYVPREETHDAKDLAQQASGFEEMRVEVMQQEYGC